MPGLQFCANLSWLFTELPKISQRIYAAAAAGFRAVEAAWPYEEDLEELRTAREATGVELVLINTPPGEAHLLTSPLRGTLSRLVLQGTSVPETWVWGQSRGESKSSDRGWSAPSSTHWLCSVKGECGVWSVFG